VKHEHNVVKADMNVLLRVGIVVICVANDNKVPVAMGDRSAEMLISRQVRARSGRDTHALDTLGAVTHGSFETCEGVFGECGRGL
jgi:hypothetical protein